MARARSPARSPAITSCRISTPDCFIGRSGRLYSTAVAIRLEKTRAAALRQSTLRDAFAGRLVPQDPSDEPAADLLARIRAEKARPAAAPKPHRTRPVQPDLGLA